jgi:hypothetical protein
MFTATRPTGMKRGEDERRPPARKGPPGPVEGLLSARASQEPDPAYVEPFADRVGDLVAREGPSRGNQDDQR